VAPYSGFIGAGYTNASLASDGERTVNWMLERVESKTGATVSDWIFVRTPGYRLWATLPTLPVQCEYQLNGRAFAVSGGVLYEVFAGGTFVSRGAIAQPDANGVQMIGGQANLLIVSAGLGFSFQFVSNTLAPVVADGWPVGATGAGFIDGYFIVLEANSQVFAISGLNDPTSWNALDFGDSEGRAGNVLAMIAQRQQLWLMSTDHGEIYYDSGAANFPFARLTGAEWEQGIAAPRSLAIADNTVVWLGGNTDGAGVLYRMNGYTPQRISNFAIEQAWAKYPTLADATAYVMQWGGHLLYRIDFPSANSGLGATWVYDFSTQEFFEWLAWDIGASTYRMHPGSTHMYAFGLHLLGDRASGNLYQLDQAALTDNGANIRRMRTAPNLTDEECMVEYDEFKLDMSVGVGAVGNVTAVTAQTCALFHDGEPDASNTCTMGVADPDQPTTAAAIGFPAPWYLTSLDLLFGPSTNTPPALLTVVASGVTTTHPLNYGSGDPATTVTFSPPIALHVGDTITPSGNFGETSVLFTLHLSSSATGSVAATPGANPQAMLRWSDDGGFTWRKEHWKSIGLTGKFYQRLVWRRCGQARVRNFSLVISDPVDCTLINAWLTTRPGAY
jgi:hypothetical protein